MRYNIRAATLPLIALLAGWLPAGLASAAVDNLQFLGTSTVNPNHLMDCEISGNRAFVSVGASQGIEDYDISDPQSPARTWYSTPNAWRSRQYGDTLLFVFCHREGVVLYDIAGTGDPVRLGQYDPPGNVEALEGGALVGDKLYAAAHQNGIYVIDVSNPASPQKVGSLFLDRSAAWNVEARDTFLFIADGRFGLAIAGLQDGIHQITRLPLPGLANDIVLDGGIAIVSLGDAGLATVDITNPHLPFLRDTIATEGNVWGSGIKNHLVIAGSWTGLELFDVSDPGQIRKIGWDHTPTWALGADLRRDSLVAEADWRGICCYRIGADPGADIEVYPKMLDFGAVSAARETTAVVRNTGSGVLSVTSVNCPSGIAANPSAFSVAAGDSQLVRITATGSAQLNGAIRYKSNDPDEAINSQEAYKNNTAFPQHGSLAPDFTLRGTDGLQHSLSDYRGRVVYLEFGASW